MTPRPCIQPLLPTDALRIPEHLRPCGDVQPLSDTRRARADSKLRELAERVKQKTQKGRTP